MVKNPEFKGLIFAVVKIDENCESFGSTINNFYVAVMEKDEWEATGCLSSGGLSVMLIKEMGKSLKLHVVEIDYNKVEICKARETRKGLSCSRIGARTVKDKMLKVGFEYSDELEKFIHSWEINNSLWGKSYDDSSYTIKFN